MRAAPMMVPSAVLTVPEDVAGDLTLLAWDAYLPLTHPMTASEYLSVCHTMRLPGGSLFPLPIVLPVPENLAKHLHNGDLIAMTGASGFQARVCVQEVFWRDLLKEAQSVYLTADPSHPGVARLLSQSPWCVTGDVTLSHPPRSPFVEPCRPDQVRALIAARKWRTVAAFQTRNPIHRAHEYLHKVALEICDGLLLHPLTGPTKSDDIPAAIRMESYRVLLEGYYPPDRVLLATFPAAMRYAGPREALFHAIVRRNYGATHFIIGRDAAGFSNFYGPQDAIRLLETHAAEVGIIPLAFGSVGYCPLCRHTVSQRTCPHTGDWLTLSGTEVREKLRSGCGLPPEFSRPEVSGYLQDALRESYAALSSGGGGGSPGGWLGDDLSGH